MYVCLQVHVCVCVSVEDRVQSQMSSPVASLLSFLRQGLVLNLGLNSATLARQKAFGILQSLPPQVWGCRSVPSMLFIYLFIYLQVPGI